MASSNSPCAACKFLRRKCTQGCVFAPYFPPDQPQKFSNVHRVFGASNVTKLLNDLNPAQREDAVQSLAYEAQARLQNPVYGCVGHITYLQHRLKQVQDELINAKKELYSYIGPAALGPFLSQQHHAATAVAIGPHHFQALPASGMSPFGVPGMGMGIGPIGQGPTPHAQLLSRDQQQQLAEAQQLAAVAREQEILRSFQEHQQQLHRHHQQQQHEFARLDSGFNQMGVASVAIAAPPPNPSLALLPLQQQPLFDNMFHVQQQFPEQETQSQPQIEERSDDGRSGIGPSS